MPDIHALRTSERTSEANIWYGMNEEQLGNFGTRVGSPVGPPHG